MFSPKTVTKTVITPVAIPIPSEPNALVATTVAREAAKICIRLFVIVSVERSLFGLDFSLAKATAPGLFSLTKEWSLNFVTEKKAISLAERKAEERIRRAKTKNSIKLNIAQDGSPGARDETNRTLRSRVGGTG
jgi:hypothetical protein